VRVFEVGHQLEGFLPVPPDLGNEEAGSRSDFLFHFVVLLHLRRLGVFERGHGSARKELTHLVPLAGFASQMTLAVELRGHLQ